MGDSSAEMKTREEVSSVALHEMPGATVERTRGGTESRSVLMFVCSSLALGRDGVGDYVRLLAQECQALGADCCLLALQDEHVSEPVEGCTSGSVPSLRLPATMAWRSRVEKAEAFRAKMEPDWISVQFVPYGFNAKGIVWDTTSNLRRVVEGARLHVMLHELWIGECADASWKSRLVGAIQRWSIVHLLRRLAPTHLTTSNGTYIQMLGREGLKSDMLALFGNIPVVAEPGTSEWVWETLAARNILPEDGERRRIWLVVFFGTLHPEWEAEPLFAIIDRAAAASGRKVCFAAIGRLGAEGDRKWQGMSTRYGGQFSFVKMGEQRADRISGLFQAADFGIAASPWQLIGKSGSAMAMLEHGLPVIANRDNWRARGLEVPEDPVHAVLHRCDDLLERKLIDGLPKREARNGVKESARKLLAELRRPAAA